MGPDNRLLGSVAAYLLFSRLNALAYTNHRLGLNDTKLFQSVAVLFILATPVYLVFCFSQRDVFIIICICSSVSAISFIFPFLHRRGADKPSLSSYFHILSDQFLHSFPSQFLIPYLSISFYIRRHRNHTQPPQYHLLMYSSLEILPAVYSV